MKILNNTELTGEWIIRRVPSEERILFFLIFNCFYILILRERKRQSMSWGGAERERETQNLKQAPGSELSAQSPRQGLNP